MSNPNSYNRLMKELSEKIGTDPSRLRTAAQGGSVDDLLSSLDASKAEQVRSLLNNRSELEKLMNSPQAQRLMKQLSEGR